jgi:flagellar biosynthesis protein FlhF
MQPVSFTAASAEEAVLQIRAKLGSDAVVLNVRPLPPNGLARLWQKPMIEVLAHVPESAPAPVAVAVNSAPEVEISPITEALAEFRQQLLDIKQQVDRGSMRPEAPVFAPATTVATEPEISRAASPAESSDLETGKWRVGAVLQKSGLLPLATQQVLDELRAQYGENPPASLAGEIALARKVLAKLWRQPAPQSGKSLHILIGPAGSGKTTCLCKWLTQSVLMQNQTARVWRLDGATANMAESLSVYTEILGAPCERSWQPTAGNSSLAEDIGFIDLPGVDWRKPMAVKELGGQIKQFGTARVHLVLNGAYDVTVLLAQVRAFSNLPIADLIVTHLDEETRWGKLWNLALATNFSIRYLSTGQNIPGDFFDASADLLLARQFPNK